MMYTQSERRLANDLRDESDFSEAKGQYHVRKAVEVAAAGGHNLLMVGPIYFAAGGASLSDG